jgi:uncharacterized protein (TIGR03083 family)
VTAQALAAVTKLYDELFAELDKLRPEQWDMPSNCPGWPIRDVVAHLGASTRQSRDPLPPMPPLAAGLARERYHDYEVTRRRNWTINEVIDELRIYVPRKTSLLAKLQDEPAASQPVEIPGLGVYPSHAVANASAFDLSCHLYLDILPALSLTVSPAREEEHQMLYSIVEWMIWGLPQMQGPLLADTVREPITLRLTGPGESAWTIRRVDRTGQLDVNESHEGAVEVTSTACDFIRWGTKRKAWQPLCVVRGNRTLATEFLCTLNIV